MGRVRKHQRTWTPADSAMWQTVHMFTELQHRRVPEYRAPTLFALDPSEVPFAAGPFLMDALRSNGDGSYVHQTAFAFGTGLLGLAVAGASMAGSAIGNANRRAVAAANAQIAWRPDFGGNITVTNRGFHLQAPGGIFRWDWESIDLMEVVAFNVIVLQGRSINGTVTWRMTSHWAELAFVLWAGMRHPQHPQLVDGSWIPANWPEWAASMGYPLPGSTQASLEGR